MFGGRLVDVLAEVVEGFTFEAPVSSGVRSRLAEYTWGVGSRQFKYGFYAGGVYKVPVVGEFGSGGAHAS